MSQTNHHGLLGHDAESICMPATSEAIIAAAPLSPVAPSEYGQDVIDEDGEHIASFIDRMDAARFARTLPWWHGRCRIRNSGRHYHVLGRYRTITLKHFECF